MTHRLVSAEVREALGIHDGFFRHAVGIENIGDIIHDFARALTVFTEYDRLR